jgi:hypothetical protein
LQLVKNSKKLAVGGSKIARKIQQINNVSSDFHQHRFIIYHQNTISYNAKEEES